MCGVAFLYAPSLSADERTGRVSAALKALRHRGPDAEGIVHVGEATLAHRRLSIVDIEGSPQPLSGAQGRFHFVYNGEIYNYREQRQRLSQAWRFQTEGDSEVLFAGLLNEGVRSLSQFEGMWGFALWDSQEHELLLARDRIGEKPLYYTMLTNGGFACASELPALRALTPRPWTEDFDSTADFLHFGYQMPGYTAYQGVHAVLPGHYLRWNPSKGVIEKPYWQLELGGRGGQDYESTLTELRETMTTSVQGRLVADVEVGAFLSGGVDSSLVCALASEAADRELQTFTIGFNETAFDERAYASQVASHLGTKHHESILAELNEATLEDLVLNHVGQPFADASLLPTALVSQLAARHVKVALSGDGADELFSGYQRYQARALLRWYTRLPKRCRGMAESAIRALPEPMTHHSRSVLKKAHLFIDIAERQEAETPYVAPHQLSPRYIRELAPELSGLGHPPPVLPQTTAPDDLQGMMAADALVYLPQDILTKVDRAAMAHGLESRAPFLDSRVISLAFGVPRTWHRRGGRGKRLLKDSFDDLLPTNIWDRRKQGFGVPIHEWFRGQLGERLSQMVSASDSPLRESGVNRLLQEHRAGRRDHGYRLWIIYVYLLWRSSLS